MFYSRNRKKSTGKEIVKADIMSCRVSIIYDVYAHLWTSISLCSRHEDGTVPYCTYSVLRVKNLKAEVVYRLTFFVPGRRVDLYVVYGVMLRNGYAYIRKVSRVYAGTWLNEKAYWDDFSM